MAIPTMRVNYVVGDYLFGKQIGVGSFSTVWHATHRVNGTEVAIKEIVTARLNAKLRESLKSEIFILKKINHPNIIRLHDVIEKSGMIYIVLEYCRGGDLSMYIQQHQGRIPEATAQHFMQQLAEGLKVLRDNNLIHRDLKPQNLLLTTKDDESSVLKIADFGFARSLQPRGLAETLCGSPLYMAPEIMQLQKYDAKADLWSIGTILFQLVTGKTPFTGSNQMQLLQNIMKSNVLRFPPEAKKLSPHCIDLCVKLLRSNPVERLTFEEFFNHSYISQSRLYESFRNPEEPFQEDHFLCNVDGKFEGRDESPSSLRRSTLGIKSGFSLDVKSSRRDTSDSANRAGSFKYSSVTHEATGSVVLKESGLVSAVEDSLESIVRGYVMVPGPPFDLSSSSCTSKSIDSSYKSGHPSRDSAHMSTKISAIVPLSDELSGGVGSTRRTESRFSSPETFQASTCIVDTSQPSTDSISQINSLQLVATAMAALVNDKIKGRKQLEAFSIQLVVLATWKQALHICDSCMESSVEGSSSQQTSSDAQECLTRVQAPPNISSHIEAAFLHEVERAEELGKVIVPGNEEMPDAMELIYQYALSFGKRGAVDEYMGDMENADTFYSKAVQLLLFILEQAPRLVMNPPFSLTNSDQDRIRTYVNLLINRQSLSQSQRMISMKSDNRSQPG